MAEERVERRLSAILAADIAGYSALMGADEARTVRDLKGHQAVVLPMVGEFGGRIIDTAGDGILAEFASVVNAVKCAVAIQSKMAERNAAIDPKGRMQFRIGVNIGDVIYDEARIYGDGINIAARLEAIGEPGGVFISRQVYDQVDGKLRLGFRKLGTQNLKNIAKPVEVFAVEACEVSGPDAAQTPIPAHLTQEIHYTRAPDGIRLAWAKVGQGPPLVRTANWLTHIEYDWESPLRRSGLINLARNYTLVRYDPRGTGLSDWDVDDFSLDAWVSDLETVVNAAGLKRFPLLAISQGCAVSITYVVRHPECVSHLILYGGFALGGKKRSFQEKEKRAAMATLMRMGWGANDPGLRQLFTSTMMPGATQEQAESFNELQRRTTSPECAVRYFETVGDFDVTDLLGKVGVPTLVMHVRGDLMNPFEAGRQMAAGIPGARFVALQGHNHMLLPGEPAAGRFREELELFLSK
jgi:class 3 adenylate cyclase/pimeloyl-ACP methyl ester carboxylesterase